MTVPDLRQVADVYLEACAEGDPPTSAVQSTWDCARSTAGRWVMAARSAGLLPETTQGATPKMNRRLVAVARALDITPERLRHVLLEHADGDLRVVPPREAAAHEG